jgi:hypothetical protein
MDVIDDDSENDSDYAPEEDSEKGANDVDVNAKELTGLSKSSKRKVDAIWLEMQEEDRISTETVMKRSLNYIMNHGPVDSRTRKNNEIILTNIFGRRVGKRLASYQATPEDVYDAEEIKKRALESVQNVKKKRKIIETRKFAGQEIQ